MEHGESLSNESTKPSTLKTIIYYTLAMGGVTVLVLIAITLALMFLSFGDNMWPILFKLKIGPGP